MTHLPTPIHSMAASFAPIALVVAVLMLFSSCQAPVEPTATPTVTPTAASTPVPTPASALTPTQPPAVAQRIIPDPREIVFPDDESPHEDPIEWWYYHGILEDEAGAQYGFHFVIFQARQPGTGLAVYQSHTAVTDVSGETHEKAVKFALNEQLQPETGFAFDIDGWTLSGDTGQHAFTAATEAYALDLSVQATRPHTLHDMDGFLAGPDGWTYYYSWTRMVVAGTLTIDGQELTVTGEAWMDHQWGDFVVRGNPSGWQWFAVRLENGIDIMVVETRSIDDMIFTYGTITNADNLQTHIENDDVTIEALGEWRSPVTSGVYPAGWRVSIPKHGLDMTLTPVLSDQEFTLTFPPTNNYWEGLVESDITLNGEAVSGTAYVELVGYVPNDGGN